MPNWKYLKIITSTICVLIFLPSLAVEKKNNLNSNALAEMRTNSSESIIQNNQKIETQQLEQQATAEFNNGQFDAAVEILQRILEIYTAQGKSSEIIRTLNKIAAVYDAQGKYFPALKFYQAALKNAQKENDNQNIIAIINNIALVYSQLGMHEQAINYYQQALSKNAPKKSEILSKIGRIYLHLNNFSQALKYYQQALEINKKNQDSLAVAKILNSIGVLYREQKKYSQALEHHQQALAIHEKENEQDGKIMTIHKIGRVHQESNKHSQSLKFLTHSLILDRQLGNQERERIHLANLGKFLEKINHPELAIIFYKQSINITENIRKNLKKSPVEHQDLYTKSVDEIHKKLSNLLLEKKRAREAHQILDLLKVQEIFEYIGSLKIDNHKYSQVPLLESEVVFWEKYNQIIDEGSNIENQNKLQKHLPKIQKFIDSEEVKSIVSELNQNSHTQKLSSDVLILLQSELNKHQQKNIVVLYPLLLEDRLELILLSSNSAPVHRTVLVKSQEFNQAILQLRSKLINRNNPRFFSDENNNQSEKRIMQAGFKLYNWLIKPIEDELKIAQAHSIIYAPDGQLRYIPLAALYDGKKWLVERFEINNITAASLMNLEPREKFQPVILAGALTEGNYNFDVGQRRFEFAALPFAGVEVENIEQIFPKTNKLLGNAFTKKAMELNMDSYSVVHFATHSAFVNGHPEESFILFGDGSRATLADVKNWNLQDVELVVLSACQTALGKNIGNGKEILGFGYQVQEAGAAVTLATLWRVDDQATHEFMNDFYAALKNGRSKVEALRKAQVTMINSEYSHPYYWAPFVLIGNGF